MGEMVQFEAAGLEESGYLALPEGGKGKGLLLIQEWWGLVPHIKAVADRFAASGFTVLAPDLYHGKVATEPDDAQKAMMALTLDLPEAAARPPSGMTASLAAGIPQEPSSIRMNTAATP